MYKVQMYADAISKLLYSLAFVRAIIYSLKLVEYHARIQKILSEGSNFDKAFLLLFF